MEGSHLNISTNALSLRTSDLHTQEHADPQPSEMAQTPRVYSAYIKCLTADQTCV